MNIASGGDELFQILKDAAVKVLHSICQQIWKTLQWPQDCKRSVFILIPKKRNAKECPVYHTIALISHAQNLPSQASTVCELRNSRCRSWIQKRQRNQRSNCQHLLGHRKREFQKNIQFCFIYCTKAFDSVDHNKLENYERGGNTRPPYAENR